MSVLPENEKIVRLDQDDEEGWVDTHHGLTMEHMQEKVIEMTLEGAPKPGAAASGPTPSVVPLVGRRDEEEESDSDSEPAVEMEGYEEEDDPVSWDTNE